MSDIIDIHTHRAAPYAEGVVNIKIEELQNINDFHPLNGQVYSVGIHPWNIAIYDEKKSLLDSLAEHPAILAIGETGIDTLKGGAMYLQLLAFKYHIELSERLKKPLIIHDVKAHDIILGVHRDLRPQMPWVIHGFRGKPEVGRMFSNRGIFLSFGEKFNSDTVRNTPKELILTETDESSLPIGEIISSVSKERREDMLPIIIQNTKNLLGA